MPYKAFYKNCHQCKKSFLTRKPKTIFCSLSCFAKSSKNLGKKPFEKGHLVSLKTREAVRKAQLGSKHSEEHKRKISEAGKGKEKPLNAILKISGENNWNWKGGITPINVKIRNSKEYALWRKSVFERDNYQCIWGGGEHGNKLHADHIKPFALFPELRFAIDNGRTLCIECHRKTDTYGGRTR